MKNDFEMQNNYVRQVCSLHLPLKLASCSSVSENSKSNRNCVQIMRNRNDHVRRSYWLDQVYFLQFSKPLSTSTAREFPVWETELQKYFSHSSVVKSPNIKLYRIRTLKDLSQNMHAKHSQVHQEIPIRNCSFSHLFWIGHFSATKAIHKMYREECINELPSQPWHEYATSLSLHLHWKH